MKKLDSKENKKIKLEGQGMVSKVSKKDKQKLIFFAIIVVLGIGGYFYFNTPIEQAKKTVKIEQKTQTKQAATTLQELLETKEDIPTVEQMRNKLGVDINVDTVREEYGEIVELLYVNDLIIPNSELSSLKDSETLREMKSIVHSKEVLTGIRSTVVSYPPESNYQKKVANLPITVTDQTYFVKETGFVEFTKSASLGYVTIRPNNVKSSLVTGYLFIEKDLTVGELLKELNGLLVTVSGNDAVPYGESEEFVSFLDSGSDMGSSEELSVVETKIKLRNAGKKYGYLGSLDMLPQLTGSKEEVEKMSVYSGTILPLVGVVQLDNEVNEYIVGFNNTSFNLVKPSGTLSVLVGEDTELWNSTKNDELAIFMNKFGETLNQNYRELPKGTDVTINTYAMPSNLLNKTNGFTGISFNPTGTPILRDLIWYDDEPKGGDSFKLLAVFKDDTLKQGSLETHLYLFTSFDYQPYVLHGDIKQGTYNSDPIVFNETENESLKEGFKKIYFGETINSD